MELRNKFDEALQNKIGDYEAEPSDKVWQRIQLASATPEKNKKGVIWWYAAAASIVLLVLAGWLILGSGNSQNQKEQLAVGEDPIEQKDKKGPHNENKSPNQENKKEEKNDSTSTPKKALPEIQILNQNPLNEQKRFAHDQKPAPQLKKEPKKEDLPKPKPSEDLFVQEEQAPQQKKKPALQKLEEITPDLQQAPLPEPILVNNEDPKEAPSPERANQLKQKFNIPAVIEDVKQGNRGGVLASLANGANQVLGLDTRYEEDVEDATTTKTFSADFKLFKIKRVKKVRNP